jgi:hypothetical protein
MRTKLALVTVLAVLSGAALAQTSSDPDAPQIPPTETPDPRVGGTQGDEPAPDPSGETKAGEEADEPGQRGEPEGKGRDREEGKGRDRGEERRGREHDRGAGFHFKRGDETIDIRCAARDSTKECVEAVLPLIESLVSGE